MKDQYQIIAEEILKIAGPKENIAQAHHCMTRLRLALADKSGLDADAIRKIPGVLGVAEAEDELQIILGPGRVNQVAAAFSRLLADAPDAAAGEAKALRETIRKKNATPFKLMLKRISNIFLPLIPAFIACGLVTGILNIILNIDPQLAGSGAVQLLKVVGGAAFWGVNLFVGVSAAKEFGASPMLGGTMAAIISHPALAGVALFDQHLLPGRGGIIAVLLVVAFSSWLEPRVRRIVPEILDLFLTPLVVILASTFAAIVALQPLGGVISEYIGLLATGAIERGGAAAGFILGGTFLPLVMTGLHQGITPIHAELLASTGVTILLPVLAMAGAGQVGASIAVYCKTKNARLKKTVASALPVGIMGVGEPLIYGVTLPLGKPFFAACVGGAFGGAVQAAGAVGATSMGLSGLPLAASTNHALTYLAGLSAAYAAGFIATWIIGFEDPQDE